MNRTIYFLLISTFLFISSSIANEENGKKDCNWICLEKGDPTNFDTTDCWDCGRIPSLKDRAIVQNSTVTVTFNTTLHSLILYNSYFKLVSQVTISIKANVELKANSTIEIIDAKSYLVAKDFHDKPFINVTNGAILGGNFQGFRISNTGTLVMRGSISTDSDIINRGTLFLGEMGKKFLLGSTSKLQNWGSVKVLGISQLSGMNWINHKKSQVIVVSSLTIESNTNNVVSFQHSKLSLGSSIKSDRSIFNFSNSVIDCTNSIASIDVFRSSLSNVQIQGSSLGVKASNISVSNCQILNKQLSFQSQNGKILSNLIIGDKIHNYAGLELIGNFLIDSNISGIGKLVGLQSSITIPMNTIPHDWSIKDVKLGNVTFLEKSENLGPVLKQFHGGIKSMKITFDSYPRSWNKSIVLISQVTIQSPLPSLQIFENFNCLNPQLKSNNSSLVLQFQLPKTPQIQLSPKYQMNNNDITFIWKMQSFICGDYALEEYRLFNGQSFTTSKSSTAGISRSKFKTCEINKVEVSAKFVSKMFPFDPVYIYSNNIPVTLPVDFQEYRPDSHKIKTDFNASTLQIKWDDSLIEPTKYPCGARPIKLAIILDGGNKSKSSKVDINKKSHLMTISNCIRYSLRFQFIFSYQNANSSDSNSISIFNAPISNPKRPISLQNNNTISFSWRSSPECRCKEVKTSFFRITRGIEVKEGTRNLVFELDKNEINKFTAVSVCIYDDYQKTSEGTVWSVDPSIPSTQHISSHHNSSFTSFIPSSSSSASQSSNDDENKSKIVTRIALIVAGVFGIILVIAIAFVVGRHIRKERIHQKMLEQERDSLLHFS